MSASAIALALRGRPSAGGYLCRCPLPSHGKGRGDRSPSLLVKDGDTALLVKCFAGCDPTDILAELKRLRLTEENGYRRNRERDHSSKQPEHRPDPEALELWRSSGPIQEGTPVARFLASRGLTISAPPSLHSTTLLHL